MCDSEAERDTAMLCVTALADLEYEYLEIGLPNPNPVTRAEAELDLIAACERQIGYLHAMQTRAIARFAKLRPGKGGNSVCEFAADEIGLAAGWTRALAGHRLHLTFALTERLPGTLAALERGEVDLRGAERLAELTKPLTPELTRQVEAAVLPGAAEQNANQLACAARKIIATLDPDGLKERHQARKEDRRVDVQPSDDAMAWLHAYLPAADAAHIDHMLDHYADAAATPDDQRTDQQRRTDVFVDLLLNRHSHRGSTSTSTGAAGNGSTSNGSTSNGGNGGNDAGGNDAGGHGGHGGNGAAGHDGNGVGGTCGGGTSGGGTNRRTGGTVVHVTMPATMLMGLDEQAGELAGYGPIPADVARMLAADATWKRLLHDPISGQLLDFGRSTYRPPAGLADFVRARDHHCIFPGCARPADACDIDHRIRYPEGTTCEENLGCLCRHHHRAKHEGGWTVELRDGVYVWTSPAGFQYQRTIEPIAEPQPPPEPPPPAPAVNEPPPF
jgi:hypothetical protein